MDNQQDDSSEIKTHDEIMRLFKDLEVVEARVKNPEDLIKEIIVSETLLQETEPSLRMPAEAVEQENYLEPALEIPEDQNENHRHLFWKRKEKIEGEETEKKWWFSFLKMKNDLESDDEYPYLITEDGEHLERIPRSTFVVQLDTNGNLVGLPVKKPRPETKNKQEEELEKGIKGRLKQLGSVFHKRGSSDAEASEGIGAKIKGIFRRD